MSESPLHRALARTLAQESWRERAACAGHPLRWWFPDESYPRQLAGASKVRRARMICARCEVSRECLRSALERGEVGIWAGTTTAERERYAHLPLEERVRALERLAARAATSGPLRVASEWRALAG